ncbi:hypothetical protein Pcinc_002754 [Petrolisthes cinctipes]|uniref:Uncharacterized protein n=1 Tax=Petrolisthes cinctipes TaxID=88211 RepID=A0AAE1GKA7_PETCI|nr:hypothetical protein Pcinc_002754 [Petrolisthes cinctipes]
MIVVVVVVGEASFPGPNHTPASTSNITRISRESPQANQNDTQGDTDSYMDDQGVQQRTESDQAAAASQDIHRTGFLLDFLMGRPRHYFRQPHPPPLPPPRRPPSSHPPPPLPPPPPKPLRHPPPHPGPPLHDVHHHHHHHLDHDPSPHLDAVDFEFDFEPPDFFESSGFLHPEDELGEEEHFHWNSSPPDHQSHELPSSFPHDNPFTSSLESFLDDPPHFPTGPPRPPIGSPIGSSDYSGPPPSHHSGPPPSHHSGPPHSHHSGPPHSHHSGPPPSHHSGPPHSHNSGPPHSHHSRPPPSHDSDHSIHSGLPFQHLTPDSPPNHFPPQPPEPPSLPFSLNSISDSSLYRDDVPVKKVTNDRDKIHDGLNPGGVKGLDPEALLTITQFTQAYINDQL